jgi:hypothetical protein
MQDDSKVSEPFKYCFFILSWHNQYWTLTNSSQKGVARLVGLAGAYQGIYKYRCYMLATSNDFS